MFNDAFTVVDPVSWTPTHPLICDAPHCTTELGYATRYVNPKDNGKIFCHVTCGLLFYIVWKNVSDVIAA
jgi:hypothetical protein